MEALAKDFSSKFDELITETVGLRLELWSELEVLATEMRPKTVRQLLKVFNASHYKSPIKTVQQLDVDEKAKEKIVNSFSKLEVLIASFKDVKIRCNNIHIELFENMFKCKYKLEKVLQLISLKKKDELKKQKNNRHLSFESYLSSSVFYITNYF